MKLLSIIVPSYNSEKFIEDCLSSLLVGLDDKLDVIVVNDGSRDKTSELAHAFADKHSFVRVLDKENGGHGSGINEGIKLAEGLYFKVLDSDDHLDKEGLYNLIENIERHHKDECSPDVYIADYVSVSVENGDRTVSSLSRVLPKADSGIDVFTSKAIKQMKDQEYFMMHYLYVKTALLKETNINLIEKTFYEDNQYVYHVLKHAKTYCYLRKPIYLYSIGFTGQSVSLTSIDKNYPHQLRVNNAMIDMVSYEEFKAMDKFRRRQVLHELFIEETLTFFYIYIIPKKEKTQAYYDHIKQFKKNNKKLFKQLKWHTHLFFIWHIPPFMRGWVTGIGYKTIGKKKGWTF